jgi:hypothetical protein
MGVLGAPRLTLDLDLLVPAERESDVHAYMTARGFESLKRSPSVSNYVRELLRVDYLYAARTYSRAMLAEALELTVAGVALRVVRPEDLIGLKIQASTDDPRRLQDLADVRHLLRVHAGRLDLDRVRTYFRLFAREGELDAMLEDAR